MSKLSTEWYVGLREPNRDDETLTQELATAKLLLPLGWMDRESRGEVIIDPGENLEPKKRDG